MPEGKPPDSPPLTAALLISGCENECHISNSSTVAVNPGTDGGVAPFSELARQPPEGRAMSDELADFVAETHHWRLRVCPEMPLSQ